MIFDCILYHNERECLEIRVNELKGLGVCHVVVQSNLTFTGKEREIYHLERLPEFSGVKMRFVNVLEEPDNKTPWEREEFQRNSIMRGLFDLEDDDIVIISDADEIPSWQAVDYYTPDMGLTALKMDNFWYYLNCLTERNTWVAPKIMPAAYLKEHTPNEIRNSGYPSFIGRAGHHFSYLGGAERISKKLSSFSHQEYNTPEINNINHIQFCLDSGKNLWGNEKLEIVPIDGTFPRYVVNNQEKFKHLIR